jgi:TonB-linked SusC/RagA family outer membrane protein
MRKILSLVTVLIFSTVLVFSQGRVVSGKITDESGNPVPFATVTEAGTKKGVTADENGNFNINITGQRLSVTAAGYKAQTLSVEGNTANIQLARSGGQLQEVVVVALGQSRSKTKLGYATTTFNSEAITRTAPANVVDGLAGKIPGANISKTGGPGSSTKVVLRGYGIISGGNNQPLYVLDGIPLNDFRFGVTNPGSGVLNTNVDFGNGLNDINPFDIESINVLRGTAAASIYGSNAKNGAIVITTRRGKPGGIKVDYAGSINFSEVGKLPEMQNIFGQGWGGIFVLPENGSWGPKLDDKPRAWGSIVNNSQLIKPFSFIKDNIRDFYNKGLEINNHIAISGGGDITQFYFSYGNLLSDGVLPSNADYYARNSLALRTNTKFKNFTINTSLNYINKRQNVPFTGQSDAAGGSTFEEILQIPVDLPITDFKDYKNTFFNVDNYFTPYAENPYYPLYENGNTQNADRILGNIDLSYKLTSDLTAELRVGGDFTNARTFRYKAVNAPSIGSWNDGANTEGQQKTPDVGTVSEQSQYAGSLNGDFILKYNKNIGSDFNLEAFGGVNYFLEDQKSVRTFITDLLIPGFYNLSNSLAPPTSTDSKQKRKRAGVYAQTILGYKNQLYLTLNARNDWSSTLPINNNSLFYPGANLAWVASQTFNLGSTISHLKFRVGYGKTGSDAAPYLVNSTLAVGNVQLPFGFVNFPFNGVNGFGISNQIGNLDLQPIITKEAEVGMEIRFLQNRIGLDVALYDKKTEGQIFPIPIAPSSGYTTQVNNIGVVSNKGIELGFEAKPVNSKDLTWSLTYTFSKDWNKVKSLSAGLNKIILNTFYDAEMDAYPGKSVTGIYAPVPKYSPDRKIVVSPTTGMPVEDLTNLGYYGDAEYDYLMGLQNTLTYKDFQLGFSFDYRKGGVMYSGTADLLLFTGNSYATTYNDRRPFIIPNSVIEVTDPTDPTKVSYEENTIVIDESAYTDYWYPTQNKAGSYSQRIIQKSFLKLRDITLSYSLPKKWASKIKASNMSLSVYGRNFLMWTPKSNFYIDPEATNEGNDIASELGEFRTAPVSHQFGVTLKASF